MSNNLLPSDVEEDCAMEEPHRLPEMRHFEQKDKLLSGQQDRFDSGYSGDSFRSTDSIDNVDSVKSAFSAFNIKEKAPVQEIGDTYNKDSYSSAKGIEPTPEEIFKADDDGDTQLHLAIIQYIQQYALMFVNHATSHEYLNLQNSILQTPLHLATITRQAPIVRRLVASGADVEIRDRNGNNPLHLACQYSDIECVYQLTAPLTWREVQQCAYEVPFQRIPQDLDALNYEGFSYLHLAAFRGEFEIMEHLLRIGADINIEDGKSGRTVLHYAVENHKTKLVQFLIKHHANVNALTFDRSSPLGLAMGRGYQDIATLLVSAGADYRQLELKGDDSDDNDDSMNDDFKIGGELVCS